MYRAAVRNGPYIGQQLTAVCRNTSPLVLVVCAITICGYLLSYVESLVPMITFTPGFLMPPSMYLWTPFTFWCMELHLYAVIVDILAVGLCGKMIEPLWGRREMMAFFVIINFWLAMVTFGTFLALYAATGTTQYLFEVRIHGLAGYVAGVLVAGRQIMPDLLIVNTQFGRLTNRNIPFTIVLISFVLWAIGLLDSVFPIMFNAGTLVSWIYLRFYQKHSNRGFGDGSDSFTFASFFPNVMQPLIGCLVAPLHTLFLRARIIRPLVPLTQVDLTSVNVTIPGLSDPQNLERRRQIALKALSERLSKTTDSSRQNLLPKSLPSPQTTRTFGARVGLSASDQHRHHHHHHQHAQHVPHMTFEVPAIALPPPPPAPSTAITLSSSSIAQTSSNPIESSTTVDLLQ